MCGIVGLFSKEPVNQRIYDSLLLLQHRGQDGAGIATLDDDGLTFHRHKNIGMVRDIFRTRNMRDLIGPCGVGQVHYPMGGAGNNPEECQPFYVNAPYGIMFVHDGNLTNAHALKQELYDANRRHVNTTNNSEVLLNVFGDELARLTVNAKVTPDVVFNAVAQVHKRVRGSYAAIALIAGKGMVAFRDPNGIRPLCYGTRDGEHLFSSESLVMEALEFKFERDLAPGEAVYIDLHGNVYSRQCAENPKLMTCAFEYVYLARPDSVIDGISVYESRLRLGEYLADEVVRSMDVNEIDVVMPIPDSSRPAAQQLAQKLNLPYREGFIKNRYVGRTFIMPGQAVRRKTVRQKLNAMPLEFKGKNVLLVDDSIVRGTTMLEIVRMTRQAGAKKVFIASGAPRVCFPNFYGIDMPTRSELICGDNKSAEEVSKILEADAVIYQRIEDMQAALRDLNPAIEKFESSCFDGQYVTGDVDEAYLQRFDDMVRAAKAAAKAKKSED